MTVGAGPDADGDGGVPCGAVLLAFADAVVRNDDDLDRHRAALVEAVGPDGAANAAATVSAFSGLVRVADGTGIPIDDGLAAVSGDLRAGLGLGAYGGAANSAAVPDGSTPFSTIDALFGPPRTGEGPG